MPRSRCPLACCGAARRACPRAPAGGGAASQQARGHCARGRRTAQVRAPVPASTLPPPGAVHRTRHSRAKPAQRRDLSGTALAVDVPVGAASRSPRRLFAMAPQAAAKPCSQPRRLPGQRPPARRRRVARHGSRWSSTPRSAAKSPRRPSARWRRWRGTGSRRPRSRRPIGTTPSCSPGNPARARRGTPPTSPIAVVAGEPGQPMSTVPAAMITPLGASWGSLQVFAASPSRAACWLSNLTVALPASTVA